ncbi:MAG: hypothetical protein ACOCPS_02420 [Desulfonatronovibrio sp.]
MKVKFLGAARGVTGSCYLMEFKEHFFAVDCGLHQGNSAIDDTNWDTEIEAEDVLSRLIDSLEIRDIDVKRPISEK